jgi:hypothetical protein
VAYFWRCPTCNRLATYDDDETPPAAWEATYLHGPDCDFDPAEWKLEYGPV